MYIEELVSDLEYIIILVVYNSDFKVYYKFLGFKEFDGKDDV